MGVGGIVLAADSQITYTQYRGGVEIKGTYLGARSKIRRIGNHSAYSIAGRNGFVDALVEAADESGIGNESSLEDAIHKCQEIFQDELRRRYSDPLRAPEARFLFCGYRMVGEQNKPARVILHSRTNFSYDDVARREPAWTGQTEHGAALYLHHRFYPHNKDTLLPLEQAKLLAYCVVAEVAEMDNGVGGPIEMELITPQSSRPLTESEIDRYKQARQRLVASVRSFLVGASQEPCG